MSGSLPRYPEAMRFKALESRAPGLIPLRTRLPAKVRLLGGKSPRAVCRVKYEAEFSKEWQRAHGDLPFRT